LSLPLSLSFVPAVVPVVVAMTVGFVGVVVCVRLAGICK
jgi:hypothetical protein